MTGKADIRGRVSAFLERDYARVVRTVAAATGGTELAEDAVQDALVKVLTVEEPPDNLAGWVTVVAINLVRQHWRRSHARDRAYVRCLEWDMAPDPGDKVPVQEAVRGALESLTPRQRDAVVLHYLGDLPVAEVAALLGVSTGTVKTQLSRARTALSSLLTSEVA